MSAGPSGELNTNRTFSNSPQRGPLEHGQGHNELSLLSLREVFLELARVEDALRVHQPSTTPSRDRRTRVSRCTCALVNE